jgi:hypothetical protein
MNTSKPNTENTQKQNTNTVISAVHKILCNWIENKAFFTFYYWYFRVGDWKKALARIYFRVGDILEGHEYIL